MKTLKILFLGSLLFLPIQGAEPAHLSSFYDETFTTTSSCIITNEHEDESSSVTIRVGYTRVVTVQKYYGDHLAEEDNIIIFGSVTYLVEKDSSGKITFLDMNKEEWSTDDPKPTEV